MHQHPRTPPVTASPASSPWTNPSRTNNSRDSGSFERPRSGSDLGSYGQRDMAAGEEGDGDAHQAGESSRPPVNQGKEVKARLSQIIQNFFIKAALIIIQSRMICPPSYNKGTGVRRVNKWGLSLTRRPQKFNVEIDETDIFREDWRVWKTCDADDRRPPPMIIETYLEAAGLTSSQALVAIDDQGKRWNVVDALNANSTSPTETSRGKRPRVVLERWTIQLGQAPPDQPVDLNAILPIVYKKSIVLFRSLFTYSKFLPSWKFARRLAKLRTNHSALRVNCKMISGADSSLSKEDDGLSVPLFDDDSRVTEDFSFGSTDSPAGPFSVHVSYRTSCEFRVDDSEALLSSHFMGVDERFFRPSLGAFEDQHVTPLVPGKEAGSLPQDRKGFVDQTDRAQAYGSLSTFHQVAPPTGSSPLSALRAAKDLGADSPSPPLRVPPSQRSIQGSRSSLRSVEGNPGTQRRPSVSFQPFKAPSLSASPANPISASSPRNSLTRPTPASALAQARSRTSAELPAVSSSLKANTTVPENVVASSGSGSPKPAPITRYSSSFGHRRGRLSSGAGSKTDEDNNSSGKGSLASSSAQPGSGMLTEAAGGGSSGSIQTDDENISEFLKMLDTKKNLKSFAAPTDAASADASSKRTSAALSKFQKMRDSNAALSDSMSSSTMLHRSSSSSSRQLSSVPPMVAGTSLSASSSPGKPISPHTPHTPAIPSRLSANSIVVDYAQPHADSGGDVRRQSFQNRRFSRRTDPGGEDFVADGTNAIDIPASPRPFHPHNRRSSSVVQAHRAVTVEDETGDLLPFGMRSASLGAEDRPPLSLSALLRLQESSDAALPQSDDQSLQDRGTEQTGTGGIDMSPQRSSSFESRGGSQSQTTRDSGVGTANALYRPRLGPMGGRGYTPPQGSMSSSTGAERTGSGTSGSERPAGGRYSFTRTHNFDEDDLLFAMSDLHFQGRRSVEEVRGTGGASSSGTSERGAAATTAALMAAAAAGGTSTSSPHSRRDGKRTGGGDSST